MVSQKRERELAKAKYERQQSRRAIRRQRQQRNAIIAGAVGVVIVLGGIFLAFRPESSPSAADTPSASASASPTAPVPTPSDVTCTDAQPAQQKKTYKKPSPQKLRAGSAITFDTNCGQFVVDLDVKMAPKTTNALAFLASSGWYTNNSCHRLVTASIFVLQCGSPKGDGQGGAGFTLPDENLPTAEASGTATYSAGSVAMANSGPNTGSSQFFIIYKDSPLGPNYSQFGRVSSGLNVVEYVAALGVAPGAPDPTDGPPAQPLVIKTATVRNGP